MRLYCIDYKERKEIFRQLRINKEEFIELIAISKDEKLEAFEQIKKYREKIAEILKKQGIKASESGIRYVSCSFGIAGEIYGEIYNQEIKSNTYLRDIFEKLDQFGYLIIKDRLGVRDGFTLDDVLYRKDDYIGVALPIKILSEILDLPLKGKSLEEYKNAIIKTCNEIIEEEKEKKNE